MGRLLLIIAVFCVSAGLNAQEYRTAEEEIQKDIHCSGSQYLAYPGPRQVRLTEAPQGMRPFYISHYGRHGSRFSSSKEHYTGPYRILAKADSLGKLTDFGKDILGRIGLLCQEADMRWGELTPLGARQHRQIAKRMFERFPEVFEGSSCIDAKSTLSIRCILSMENALTQLVSMNPCLRIRHDASHHDLYYMKYDDKKLKAHRMDSTIKARYQKFVDQYDHRKEIMSKLFNDKKYVRDEIDASQLTLSLFDLASIVQNMESRKKLTLYDLFSDEAVYDIWRIKNMEWYINYGAYTPNGGKQPYGQRFLLRKIIEEADSCIQLEQPGATLRFGHDTNVLPLVCLMELNNYGLRTDNLEVLERMEWVDFKAIPMGANLQMIFYRKNTQDKDVFVKVLLNENEVSLPVESDEKPYYRWSDVRDYYLKKLDAYQD